MLLNGKVSEHVNTIKAFKYGNGFDIGAQEKVCTCVMCT